MIAQIQVVQVPDMTVAKDRLMAAADELVRLADQVFPSMKQFGGGAKRRAATRSSCLLAHSHHPQPDVPRD